MGETLRLIWRKPLSIAKAKGSTTCRQVKEQLACG